MIKKISNQYDLKEFHRWLENKKGQFVGLDTETTGLKPLYSKVLLLQIGDKYTQYVIDVARVETPGSNQVAEILNCINKYDIKCIAHNAQFDYKMLKANFKVEVNNLLCTLLSAQLLTRGLQYMISMSLANTLERFMGIRVDKSVRVEFQHMTYGDRFTDEQIEYAGKDVAHLIPLKDILMAKLEQHNLLEVAVLEFQTIKVTGDMELNGALIDTKLWAALEAVALDEAEKIRKDLDVLFEPFVDSTNLFGDVNVNYNSPQQMTRYLSKALGKTLTSTDAKTLKKINKPITNQLLKYRGQMKLAGTYGSEFLRNNLEDDGRIRSDFYQLGTDTGRYASKNPNLQNIPADPRYRRPFIAPKGYKFISTDFSGQELRLLAHLSQEPGMITALKEKKDLHSYSASLLYKKPYEDFFEYEDAARTKIKLDEQGEIVYAPGMKRLRNNTKKTSFGLLYGMGPGKLADDLGITLDEGKAMMRLYFDTFPKVEKLMIKLAADVRRNKYALSPLDGRKMFFYDLDWDHKGKVGHAERQGKNLPFQGAGASTTKQALVYIDEQIKARGFDAKIIFAVHDEINCESRADQADECAKMIQEQMIRAFNKYAPSVPMEAVAAVGDWWIH